MNYFKIILMTMLSFGLSSMTYANNEHIKIQKFMNQYTDFISCNNEIKVNNIINMTTTESYRPIYYVLWQGDIGCLGGSGTTTMNLSLVEANTYTTSGYIISTYPVLPDEVYYELNPRFIESFSKNSSNQIQIISWQAKNDMELNYPSIKTKYTLKRTDENGSWKIVNSSVISAK